MGLSEEKRLAYARQWYVEFMKQCFDDWEVPDKPDWETAREMSNAQFDLFSLEYRHAVGAALRKYREALKARDDAVAHVEYAKAYRGAPDDTGDGWKPDFEYYARRRKSEGDAEAVLARMSEDLAATFAGIDENAHYFAYNLAEACKKSSSDMRERIEKEVEELKRAARERTASLGKKKQGVKGKEPTKPIPADGGGGSGNQKQTAKHGRAAKRAKGGKGSEKQALKPGSGKKKGKGGDGDDVNAENARKLAALGLNDKNLEWRGRLELDENMGAVHLWLGVHDERIRKRVAHKAVDLAGIWDKEQYWTNGAPGAREWGSAGDSLSWPVNSVPTELYAHQKLVHPSGRSSIVQLLNHGKREDAMIADLYLEWCPFGDAADLVKVNSPYCNINHGDRQHLPAEDFSSSSTLLPEPFCWAVFLSMVKAGLMMERGQVPTAGTDQGWSTMIHRDLKVSNIFLGMSGQEFSGYPQPKVGDFGITILGPPGNTQAASDIESAGTTGHIAPETEKCLTNADGSLVRQSTKTNVWGMGLILYSLLAGRFGPIAEDVDYFQYDRIDKREPPEFDTTTRRGYNQKLQDLVRACLRYEAKDRPTFDFLLTEVLASTNGDQADLADGMRVFDLGDPGFDAMYAKNAVVDLPHDRYAVGLAFDEDILEEDGRLYIPSTDYPEGLSSIS